MNQTFDLTRFGLLVRKTWIENRKMFFYALIIQFGWTAFWFFDRRNSLTIDWQTTLFNLTLLPTGFIFANYLTNHQFGEKNKTIGSLLLPASALEKLLVILFYSLFLFAGFQLVTFLLMDNITYQYAFRTATKDYLYLYKSDNPQIEPSIRPIVFSDFKFLYQNYFIGYTFAIFGGIYFPRLSFVKTAAASFLLFLSIIWLNTKALGWYIDNFQSIYLGTRKLSIPVTGFIFTAPKVENLEMNALYANEILMVSVVLIVGMMLLATYFRLKEKQI